MLANVVFYVYVLGQQSALCTTVFHIYAWV